MENNVVALNNSTMGITGQNLMNGYWWDNHFYPYYQPTYITYTTPPAAYDFQIRKVQNGFIVLRSGVEYVFESVEKMNKFLEKELK